MTSSQQPPQPRPSHDLQDPATYLRKGCPVPYMILVRALQSYKNWVEDGGLDKFASTHGVEPDFIYRLYETDFKAVFAYLEVVRAMPGLEDLMEPTLRLSVSHSSARQIIDDCENGWSSEEEAEDEDDKEETEIEEELQGTEEEGVETVSRSAQGYLMLLGADRA
ncbi:hypothetical protein BDW02DRAFT_577648 [Decorospora gaudefroyi]|uniref:Uncharacterized protein n=1 Tax=Decorospora gaudefroyi TaxID=184978 RepID=A0A6A5KLW0_9PLEO|nr:hypothetical protein BDW02DRAFT_577648 [Decorospora gaudefroyi]